jgi:polyhydroxyalkanoate synthesis regulator phasin
MKANKKWMTRIGAGVGIAALSIGAITGVANAVGSTHKADGQGRGPIAGLVTAGTLTTEQATAVHDALETARDAKHTQQLASLVAAGTITQAEADALATKDGMRELIESGDFTREEARALKDKVHNGDKPDMVAEFTAVIKTLVSAGTITQTQADALIAAAPSQRPEGGSGKGKMGKQGGPGGHGGPGNHGGPAGQGRGPASSNANATA